MTAPERGAADLIRRCHSGLDAASLMEELLHRLHLLVPFDTGLIATTDPATLFYTGAAFAEKSQVTHLPGFLANEYLDEDVMKYADLAAGPFHVDWLSRSTRGDRESSARYRNLLSPIGLGDELRAAFVAGGSCWGVGCLAREQGSVAFDESDARLMSRLAPHIGDGLRKALLVAQSLGAEADPEGPGVLVLAEDLSILASTPAAERWLEELAVEGEALFKRLPASVVNVATALGASQQSQPLDPSVRVRTNTGRWLVLHASYLGAEAESRSVAVVIEPAQRAALAPLILQTHGLTTKESQVAGLVLLGRSTREIAAELFISEHTVQDHLKSIFGRVGVGSRRELVIKILSDQYLGFDRSLP